jgi:hypothetical protein
MATSFSGGRSRSTRREPPTMGKQLVNLITCAASRVHPFCNLQSRARNHVELVICFRGGSKISSWSGGHTKFWGYFVLKSRFYAKKSYFFPILGGGGGAGYAPWIRPWACASCWVIQLLHLLSHPGPLCYIYCVMVRVSINQKAIGIHVQNYKFGNCILFG